MTLASPTPLHAAVTSIPLRAVDLYSGVGGWSLGLKLAGISVVGAFEIWPEAVATYNANLRTRHLPTDLGTLSFARLPKGVDLVVGSPPCTEFSFSNRGGGGNVTEGLKEIVRFLEIVEYLKPACWILENVPRIVSMVCDGIRTKGHPLFRFRHLRPTVRVVNFVSFGVPQSRQRCLVGSFPFELLETYKHIAERRTLGQVIAALGAPELVEDPVWGGCVRRSRVSETEPEPQLDDEQLRMNRESKQFHPVYNDMSFPDRLDVPARTITATCTRVSRESIVIEDPESRVLRRLTVRERATLQGFPLTYQFLAKSHSSKIKMIGNAVPPFFSFFVGMACRNKTSSQVRKCLEAQSCLAGKLGDVEVGTPTPPHGVAKSYPSKRRFRSALPGLRFKSGLRFELANQFDSAVVRWKVSFFYGSSKHIKQVGLNGDLYRGILKTKVFAPIHSRIQDHTAELVNMVLGCSSEQLQNVWIHRAKGIGPFQVTDALGHVCSRVAAELHSLNAHEVKAMVLRRCGYSPRARIVPSKIVHNSREILAGFIVGSLFNQTLDMNARALRRAEQFAHTEKAGFSGYISQRGVIVKADSFNLFPGRSTDLPGLLSGGPV